MLLNLKYDTTFRSTGKSLSQDVKFKQGFGAIIGPNESGKSMIIEMIRYALFGTAALRGTLVDYVKLEVLLTLRIKDTEYSIVRSSKDTTLSAKGKPLAIGTRPVNTKIIQILGFGLDVFDLSCVAMQGEIEKLGTMLPAERKRMVDSVIGLSIIEDLGKSANDQALALKRDADVMESTIRVPEEPVKPTGYHLYADVDYHAAIKAKNDYDYLIKELSNPPVAPVKPPKQDIQDSRVLSTLRDGWIEKKAKLSVLKPHEAPSHTHEELEAMEQQYVAAEHYARTEKRIAELRKQIKDAEDHAMVCPNCGHSWVLDQATVQVLKDKLNTLLQGREEFVPYPDMSIHVILRKITEVKSYDPTIQKQIDDLTMELEAMPDYDELLRAAKKYEAQVYQYNRFADHYEQELVNHQNYRNEAEKLLPIVDQLQARKELSEACTQYNIELRSYQKDKKLYDEQVKTVTVVRDKAADWKLAKEALVSLRTKIKQYLLPSLNLWASRMLSQMTGGARNIIEVDDDFDIKVDGQPLNTLSGSGKAVANLALRIGLGQVLTNGVLSLFIGDEIDAAMDKDRAENTANALQTLRKDVLQILLVTHKLPVADYYIDLGKTNEQTDRAD